MIKTTWQMRLGNEIKQQRSRIHLSCSDLSGLTGVDQSQISRFERGKFQRKSINLHKICKFLKINEASNSSTENAALTARVASLIEHKPAVADALNVLFDALEHQQPSDL